VEPEFLCRTQGVFTNRRITGPIGATGNFATAVVAPPWRDATRGWAFRPLHRAAGIARQFMGNPLFWQRIIPSIGLARFLLS
jgi:hypothetical protein